MGVSIEGGGRRRGLMVELNLVPFIDFMSCLIAFLMIAAIWVQLTALSTEQSVSGEGAPSAVPLLTAHLRADSVVLFREAGDGVTVAGYDPEELLRAFEEDHRLFPTADTLVVAVDEGVAYGVVIGVLDLSRRVGYPMTVFADGESAAAGRP